MSDFPYVKIKNFINGQWREEADAPVKPLYNPSTGGQIGEVPMSGADACEAAIATAWEAYQTWREVPVAKRVAYIFKLREAMIRNHEKLAQGIAWDQAKHISEARGEVQRVIEILESACGTPSLIQGDILDQVSSSISVKVVRQSLGVFGGVAPFSVWTVIAFLFLAGILYLLFRKNKYDEGHLTLRSVEAAVR